MDERYTLTVEREIPGPIAAVFDAWLDAATMAQWAVVKVALFTGGESLVRERDAREPVGHARTFHCDEGVSCRLALPREHEARGRLDDEIFAYVYDLLAPPFHDHAELAANNRVACGFDRNVGRRTHPGGLRCSRPWHG